MPGDRHSAEGFVEFGEEFAKPFCYHEPVYQYRLAAQRSIFGSEIGGSLMRKHMERLQAGWVTEVGGICVGIQCQIRVRCVGRRKIWYEVVEAAIVGVADRPNLFKKLLGGFWCYWGPGNETKAVFFLSE